MLMFINIANLAVIHRVSFELHEGLCLLTGETGAGKSIIVDALGLLLGRRGSSEIIRTGERVAYVEGVFGVCGRGRETIGAIIENIGLEPSADSELIIRREIYAGGRNRVFINDQSVAASALKLLQPHLLVIQGQGEQYTLATKQSHFEFLDIFAGCAELRHSTAKAFERWRGAEEALQTLRHRRSERERLGDFLRFQIAEIENANFSADEDASLEAERSVLSNAERILNHCASIYTELYEGDPSVLDRVGAVRKRVQEISAHDGRAKGWLEMIENASALISEVAGEVRRFKDSLDFSPQRLGEIESRLAQLERLKRKYGKGLGELEDFKRQMVSQLAQVVGEDEREGELVAEAEAARRVYLESAQALSEKRRAAAGDFGLRVMEELKSLALGRAVFNVSVGSLSAREADVSVEGIPVLLAKESEGNLRGYSPNGVDRVEFLMSANEGEALRPLSRVASGGELSRLMLAIRTVCSNSVEGGGGNDACLVFDEIDIGIGGQTAEAVGLRLKRLAKRQQVLCVTHEAQIARFADHHYVVAKKVDGGRTHTTVEKLDAEGRVREISRMIGGSEDFRALRETAKKMLEGEGVKRSAPRRLRVSGEARGGKRS